MKRIEMPSGHIVAFDDDDEVLVRQYRWRAIINRKPNCDKIYAYGYRDGKNIMMHRLFLAPERGVYCDHIDGDGLNNIRSNLRLCTSQENSRSARRILGPVPLKGVTIHFDGTFRARIKTGGKNKHLGLFGTPEEAARAYDKAALALFGEFALTNEQMGLLDVTASCGTSEMEI